MSPVKIPAVLLSFVVLSACHQLFGLQEVKEEDLCGDGELLAVEECDDGGNIAGDGCGTACQIEPAFECLTMNEPCLPVVGVSRGPVSTELPVAGDNSGGNVYAFTCPASEVVIGFEGYVNSAQDNMGSIRVVCGALAVTANGDVLPTRSSHSEYFGASPTGSLLSVLCPQGEVGTGFLPNINTYVSGFEWECQPVAHSQGTLQFGATSVQAFGPATGIDETIRRCPQGEVVSTAFGATGASVDSMGLRCSRLSAVVCGDGELTAPEMCDDGNLLQGDGCGRRCQLE